ncbi:MAG: DUF507 family protein, partial [Myxococcaceae bacterium]
IRIFHNGIPVFQKPVAIIKSVHINITNSYNGITIPIEIEREIMRPELSTKIIEKEIIYINIPPGVDDGEIVLLQDKGHIINDQLKGDIKITVHVENNSPFLRSGLDLLYRKTITLKESLCGFAFEIIHLNGKTLCMNNMTGKTIIKPKFRKIIPKIAKDSIRSLSAAGLIELEEGKAEEAELDLAGVMVEYLDADERLNEQAKDLLSRRGLGSDRFAQAKKTLADTKNFKIGDEALDYILGQLAEALLASKNIEEVFGEDPELRKAMKDVMDKYASIPEELDKEARQRLKNLREGSPEWEIEYPRAIAQLKRQKGL